MDDKAFREVFLKDITEFVKEADANDLVENVQHVFHITKLK